MIFNVEYVYLVSHRLEMDTSDNMDTENENTQDKTVLVQIKSENGDVVGDFLDLPRTITSKQLQLICNALLQKEEQTSYAFFVNEREITSTLDNVLDIEKLNTEQVIDIIYQEQAVFKVRPVTRCTSSLPGHSEPVLSTQFSPDSLKLASGSGDCTLRLWDIHTQTPLHTCSGHIRSVLCIAWSPDSKYVVSGCENGTIISWNSTTGKRLAPVMTGHKKWITALAWEPYHLNPTCRRFASSGKDGNIRIWDVVLGHCLRVLSSHTQSITCIKWGGSGLIYSSSQDRSIKVWRAEDGVLCRTLQDHGHWVNTLALNTDYAMRTAVIDFLGKETDPMKIATTKYNEVIERTGCELLVSGSDDWSLRLWTPEKEKKSIATMTGHQKLINCVQFSPDARLIASASFDKSIKLWDGKTGQFLATLRGHVQSVYMIAWSCDSRLLVSGSADSTLKVWDMKEKKLMFDLPGHADEVYAVDWSPDGQKVVSGGKDKLLRLWQH